ncbi:MAG TPA: hypothetical protein VGC41_27250, partial [Kofleriaceae bacterium]
MSRHLILVSLLMSAACGTDDGATCSDVSGTACTWAGVRNARGFNGDGLALDASWLAYPADVTFGPDGSAWIVDWNNHRIRHVEADGTLKTVVGTGYEGDGPDDQSDRLPVGNAPGAPGTTVALNHPTDLAFMPDGSIVFASWHNNKIRTYEPTTGISKVLAGDSYGFNGDGGPAYNAVFNVPKALAVEPSSGDLYLIDQRNERLRMIASDPDRTITTVGGDGTVGYAGDGGDISTAQFNWQKGTTPIPDGALKIHDGALYIADSLNSRIRRMDLATHQISCIAGNGTAGAAGDGGPALAAQLDNPLDMEFGPDGRLYVADTGNNTIRAI